jgi:four helix bundle protein
MHNYRELKIWQRSMDLCENVYMATANFPKEERFGLTSQIKDCATSIPSNIAEGAGRNTNKQFRHFLEFSMGSDNELQTRIELARRFKYIEDASAFALIDEALQIFKMILSFYNSLPGE